MKQFIIALVFLLLSTVGAEAATFYVAKSGSDGNSCAQAQNASAPKLTITAAFNCIGRALGAGAGQIVEVAAGTYAESLDEATGTNIPRASSWAAPFTFTAKSGDAVTIKPNSGLALRWVNPGAVYTVINGFRWDGTNDFDSALISVGGCCNGPSDIKFTNNDLTNIQASHGVAIAVNEFAQRIDITKNKFHDFITAGQCDTPEAAYACGYPLYYKGSNGTIEGNEMYNIPSYGVHMYMYGGTPPFVSNNIVRNNLIHDFSQKMVSAAGILLSTGENNQAYNNIVYNGAVGIAISSSKSTAYNNTVYN